MVKVIIIRTSGDLFAAVTTLNRIKRRLPMMVRKGMMRWGKILVRDMKLSARKAGIKRFSGTLQGLGIRWEQRVRGDTGYLFMRLYAVYLDSMAPHYVNVTRRRTRLLLWAKIAKKPNIRRKARMVEKRKLKSFSTVSTFQTSLSSGGLFVSINFLGSTKISFPRNLSLNFLTSFNLLVTLYFFFSSILDIYSPHSQSL